MAACELQKQSQAPTSAELLLGVGVLPKIADLLALGITSRAQSNPKPLDILLCENQHHCSEYFRELVSPLLLPSAKDFFDNKVGLVETTIGRMVPAPTATLIAEDPLFVLAEPYMELPVAKGMFKGPIPDLVGLLPVENFQAYEHRKLFMHNAGHAALAYLGYEKGLSFIWECAQDGEVRQICDEAMREVAAAMVLAFPGVEGMDRLSLALFSADLMKRFENKALGDTVQRVAADPMRKLRSNDRLIGAAKFCEEYAVAPHALAKVIASALQYDYAGDESATRLQALRLHDGDRKVLETVCGVEEGSKLLSLVFAEIKKPFPPTPFPWE